MNCDQFGATGNWQLLKAKELVGRICNRRRLGLDRQSLAAGNQLGCG